jgi:hypothetical protein
MVQLTMTRRDSDSAAAPVPGSEPASPRREYVPPKLERLGTIRDLTQGEGQNNQFDGANPPGQNKSFL